jgi:hypothetical protein
MNRQKSMEDVRRQSLQVWAEAQRKALHEAVKNTPVAPPAQAAAGTGVGAGGSFATALGNFAATFSQFLEIPATIYSFPQSATSDADGNLYTLSKAEYEGPITSVLRKISPVGEIVWQYLIQAESAECDVTPTRIRLSPDGYLYTIFKAGIAKFNPEDGALIWTWLVNTDTTDTTMSSLTFLLDGTPVTLSNYDDAYTANLLCTWDKETGDKLSEKEFYVAGTGDQYVNADIINDGEDNIVLPLAYYDGETYGTEIVKWDLVADEEVWTFNINQIDYENEDQDVTGMGIDDQGNIYVNGYGRGLTKFSPLGDLIWARVVGTYMPGLAVSPDGDCYMYGDPGEDLQVTKISTDGDVQWSYRISAGANSLDNGGWLLANSMAQYVDGSLYLMAGYDPTGTEQELILKVGEQQILGEYGPFTFTDYTVNILTVNPADAGYPLNPDDTNYLTEAGTGLTISPEGLSPQTIEITNLP